jgi:pSer/pThr/pTyr-binding forkhead associated (FHA) protein
MDIYTTGIRGTSGQYAGKEFEIKTAIIVGRNPKSSNIIFMPAAPGISSVHCELYRENELLKLRDIGSTNGTFLNGNRLATGVAYELKTGDTFFLGSPINAFIVY